MASRSMTDTQRETLAVFDGSEEPLTTTELAKRLDLGRRSAYGRLERLAERGELETKKVGANARVWWRSPERPPPGGERDDGSGRRFGDGEALFSLLVDAVEEYAIFHLDEDGNVRTWNQGAREIKGYEADEVVGEHFSTFYTEDDRASGVPDRNLAEAAESGDTEDEGWRVRKDGARFWANVTITAIRDEQGELRGFAKVTRDMTERREQEEAIRRERDLIDRVFETSPVGLGVLSRDGLERFNARAAAIYGSSTGDIDEYTVGEPAVYDADGEPVPPADRPNARVFETGEPVTGWECQLDGVDDQRRWLSVSAAPLTDDAGDVERVVVATEDITRFKEQARRLERQRDVLEVELDDVFERVDDAFCALDGEFRFTYVNDRAAELLQVRAGELLGDNIWDLYPEATESPVWGGLHGAMETQETTEFEVYGEELDVWLHASVYPSETGLSVYFRDVTERKQREKALRKSEERFRMLMEHSPFSMQIFDAEGRPIKTNPAWERLWEASREELEDYNILQDPQLEAAGLAPHIRDAFGGEVVELPVIHYDPAEIGKPGRSRWIEGYVYPLLSGDDETLEVALVHHDITERKARERELERYEMIVETVRDGVYAADEEYRFTMVNDGYAEMVGYDREELVGSHISTVVDDDTVALGEQRRKDLVAGVDQTGSVEIDLQTKSGESITVESRYALLPTDESFAGTVGVVRDITERKERERELELYETIVSTIDDGVYVLDDAYEFVKVNDAYVEMTGYDREELLGAHSTLVVDDAVSDESAAELQEIADGKASSATLEADLLRADGTSLRAESNFTALAGDGPDGNWKVGVVRDVSERVARERELERQRGRLATLNDLNQVVRALSEAAIDQSTRAEIEQAVCEGLAASGSFRFAWIGEVDGEAMTVRSRTEAGVEGFLDGETVTIDLDEPGSSNLIGRAVKTHEVQVVEDVSDHEGCRLRERASEWGFRSAAAVPVTHEGALYGVLNLYADRPDAFIGGEGDAIGHLGEIVGHAISATERRRALTSDDVVEVEFRVPDVFGAFDLPTTGGRITFDRAIPVGDGVYLEYGTATPDMLEVLEALVEDLPHWESVRLLDEGPGEEVSRFELRLVEPPLLSSLSAVGGYVDLAAIEGGDLLVRLHVAPNADVRQVIGVVEDEYPMAEMLARRQVTRTSSEANPPSRLLVEDLTDRQRAALEAAFFSGYFESPRPVSGEHLADTLGIAGPTFHQHLRNAQRTVLSHLLQY